MIKKYDLKPCKDAKGVTPNEKTECEKKQCVWVLGSKCTKGKYEEEEKWEAHEKDTQKSEKEKMNYLTKLKKEMETKFATLKVDEKLAYEMKKVAISAKNFAVKNASTVKKLDESIYKKCEGCLSKCKLQYYTKGLSLYEKCVKINCELSSSPVRPINGKCIAVVQQPADAKKPY